VKWFVDEDGSDEARRLRDNFVAGELDLIAPDLLRYEVACALRYHPVARSNTSSLEAAIEAIENYQFLINPSREAWSKAIQFCYESKISPYDAIYLGVSQALKLPLVTADEKLIDTLKVELKVNVIPLAKSTSEPNAKSTQNDVR